METQEKLEAFADLVRSSPHNLVSRRARDELSSRHIPECLALAALLPGGTRRVLDLGSGGGFPGMVIAIARPELEVHLLDATTKKTAFLRAAASELDVTATVHTGRAEELRQRPDLAGSFDVVTARAVAPLARLVPWAVPFLEPGGVLYAMKGERWADELQEAEQAMAESGAQLLATPDDAVSTSVPASPEQELRVVMLARAR